MKTSIIKNLSWVLICSLVVKLIGGVYRIVLTRILSNNIGLYQMVFSVYSFLTILITSGISISISKIVSSKKMFKDRQKVVCGVAFILITLSLCLAVVLFLGSKGLALLQGEIKIYVCYMILAPSLIFSAGCAIFRGYYQGCERFSVSSISNVLEQLARVLFGLAFMLVLQKYYILGALIGAIIGNVFGDLVAFIYLKYKAKDLGVKYSYKYINDGKKVFKYSYPIMLYAILIPLSNLVDGFLIAKLLGFNFGRQSATFLYGLQSGVVGAIISIPNIFSFALVSVLMPALSKDITSKNLQTFKDKIRFSFKLILLVALPCAIFFMINASNVLCLIYGEEYSAFGVDGIYVSKNLLIISSVGIVFSAISQLCSVILQNINKKATPIINLGIALILKLLIELMFVPSIRIGVYAYAIAISLASVVSGVLNLYAVQKYLNDIIDLKFLSKLSLSCVILLGIMLGIKTVVPNTMFVLYSIFSAIIYFVIIYLFKIFSKDDIKIFINKY